MQHAHAIRAPLSGALSLIVISMLFAAPAEATAPKISGTPPTTATVGSAFSFQPTVVDPDDDPMSYQITNKPAFLSFSTSTGRLSGTPGAGDVRAYSGIVITVSDSFRTASLPAFTLTVKSASGGTTNKPPVLSGTPITTAKVGTAYSFQPQASDPEGHSIAWSVRGKPSWAAFSTTTGKLSGTPTTAGVYSGVGISASDGTNSVSTATFTITVSAAGSTSNTAPTISGTPPASVVAGSAYSFQPTAADANKDPLSFSVTNKPSWATLSSTTGKLSGTPTASNVGTTSNIVIKVSDGKTSTALKAFSITVNASGGGTVTGAATVIWSPPTTNNNGSALTNLAGYRISYGKTASTLSTTVTVSNPGVTNYVIENLAAGTWYFGVKSYTSSGTESAQSNIASKTVK